MGFRSDAERGSFHFRGIPYAASVGGPNRFLPPQRRTQWTEPLECFTHGAAAHQSTKKSIGKLLGAKLSEDLGIVGDDCLNLNIVAPMDPLGVSPGVLRPVLVWIHGGANASGSNAQLGHLQPLDEFSTEGVVCVSLNYRLALHGFLHLPAQGVTNLAIRDLLAGLQWIQTEIAAFGGDPSNVTIWGQSAGAINVATLLSSPAAKGLFHKAILMSGGPGQWASLEEYKNAALADMTAALAKAVPGLKLHESGEPLLEDLTSRATPEAISKAGVIHLCNVSLGMQLQHVTWHASYDLSRSRGMQPNS